MSRLPQKPLINEVLDKEKWRQILQRFIDVLQINIFIVDAEGRAFLTPSMGRYGWKLLSHSSVGVDMFGEHSNSLLTKFKKQGFYLEYHYPFMLHSFAVPMDTGDGNPVAYMVIGPVILNKRLDNAEYEEIARNLNLNFQELMDAINEIKVVSFISLKSILDLLYEVSQHIIGLGLQKQKTRTNGRNGQKEGLAKAVLKGSKRAFSSAYFDELFGTLLDVAMSLTKTECGSIMIVDDEAGDLTIKISRGLDNKIVQNARIKIGEGVAGLAAQENTSFVIRGSEGDDKIKPYLKRPEIRQAFITPLASQNRVFGVMNLHTKGEGPALDKISSDRSLDIIKQLSKLAETAVQGIQQSKSSE